METHRNSERPVRSSTQALCLTQNVPPLSLWLYPSGISFVLPLNSFLEFGSSRQHPKWNDTCLELDDNIPGGLALSVFWNCWEVQRRTCVRSCLEKESHISLAYYWGSEGRFTVNCLHDERLFTIFQNSSCVGSRMIPKAPEGHSDEREGPSILS